VVGTKDASHRRIGHHKSKINDGWRELAGFGRLRVRGWGVVGTGRRRGLNGSVRRKPPGQAISKPPG
jgi:hypothetical protein